MDPFFKKNYLAYPLLMVTCQIFCSTISLSWHWNIWLQKHCFTIFVFTNSFPRGPHLPWGSQVLQRHILRRNYGPPLGSRRGSTSLLFKIFFLSFAHTHMSTHIHRVKQSGRMVTKILPSVISACLIFMWLFSSFFIFSNYSLRNLYTSFLRKKAN